MYYKVEEGSLTAVADAIRDRAGTTGAIAFPDGFVSAVEGIPEQLDHFFSNSIISVKSNVQNIISRAFEYVSSVVSADFPELKEVAYRCFYKCSLLVNVNLPKATLIGDETFYNCTSLKKVDLPMVNEIWYSVFDGSAIEILILRRTDNVCTLRGTSALNNTPIGTGAGYIYVPSALVDRYKSATNWSTFAAQFRALEDYTVDGTTTGAFDETKI